MIATEKRAYRAAYAVGRKARLRDSRATLIAGVRERFNLFHALPKHEQELIEANRLLPVSETVELFEMAMTGDLIFPPEPGRATDAEVTE